MLQRIERQYLKESPPQYGRRHLISVPASSGIDWSLHEQAGLPPTTSVAWKALDLYLAFPWYRRVWIIQEVVKSPIDPILLCGNVQCSWTTLSWAAHWLCKHGYGYGYVLRTVNCIDTLLQLRFHDIDYHLDALLVLGHSYYSTDPRDKIYALLALEKPSLRADRDPSLAITPDYFLSVSEAYSRAIRNIIVSTRSLSILSLPMRRLPGSWDFYRCFGRQAFSKDQGNRPSWLPHFEDVPSPKSFVHYNHKGSKGASSLQCQVAEANVSHKAAFYLDEQSPDTTLAVSGVEFDSVHICLEARPWHGLAEQHSTSGSPNRLSLMERTNYYYRDCRHVGTLRLFLYILDGFLAGFHRPLVLRMWECALEYSDTPISSRLHKLSCPRVRQEWTGVATPGMKTMLPNSETSSPKCINDGRPLTSLKGRLMLTKDFVLAFRAGKRATGFATLPLFRIGVVYAEFL